MTTPSDSYRRWARFAFGAYRGAIAYLETVGADGSIGIGNAFHVGEGVMVTARHVIEGRAVSEVGFDDWEASFRLLEQDLGPRSHGSVSITDGPYYHSSPSVDVCCFRVHPFPKSFLPLGGHLDDYLGQYELVLYRTLVMGYPSIPMSNRPTLLASGGEINALVDKYTGGHPHFIVSTIARGGFSGAPVLVAYNEDNSESGTAVLGVVTESLVSNGVAPELGYMAVLTVEPIYDCLEKANLLPACQRYESES